MTAQPDYAKLIGPELTSGQIFAEFFAPSALPLGHDPLGDGILMAHQVAWIEDLSPLKLAAKGRRTGITYAEALDDTLIAATSRAGGGSDVFYIGDTKEKGLEFIRYVAHFALVVSHELAATVQDYLFPDEQPDGSTKYIAAYKVTFASGYRVVALSSRPANIRGLQGIVVIDEAAFHPNVSAVLDAVNALLIWGGRIRIISSHNGEDNPFNLLIKDTEAGHYDYKIHHIPFSLAIKNGLYDRVRLMLGEEACAQRLWTPDKKGFEKWVSTIVRSYGPRIEARDEELEAIPRKSSGVYLPRALVQKAQDASVPTVAWSVAETFYLRNDRLAVAKEWFEDKVRPLLRKLNPLRASVLGQDFGRNGDLSAILVAQEADVARWRSSFLIELRRVPFDVQRWILFEILRALPNWLAKFDARGNGQSHAEAAAQEFGLDQVECVMFTAAWYAQHFPDYKADLEDQSFILPGGEDVVSDHRLVVLRNGFPAISDGHVKGSDGEERHGDSAVAAVLAHAASRADRHDYGYQSACDLAGPPMPHSRDDDDNAGRRRLWG
jgi:phage FluMu gp28-like protein